MGIPSRHGVPVGWEAFPWSYFIMLREMRIEGAPMVVVRDGDDGPELCYSVPGFRDAVRAVLAAGTSDLKGELERVSESAREALR